MVTASCLFVAMPAVRPYSQQCPLSSRLFAVVPAKRAISSHLHKQRKVPPL